jgi:hypothetical protein
MTSHPNRKRAPYTATIGGQMWADGPAQQFPSIKACRDWAESYGDTADWCAIADTSGTIVARHQRDRSTNGWYRAEC